MSEKQTTTWYLTGGTRNPITPVEVEKETAHFLVIKGRRESKTSGYYRYFRTEADAIAHHVRRAQSAVLRARRDLAQAEQYAEKVRALFPDAPEWQTEPDA